jgi:hypothetical protein
MDTRIPPVTGATATTTTARPTPRPYRVQFSEVLAGGARGLVRGAENAMRVLPGGSLMSVAVRGGGTSGALPMTTRSASGTGPGSAEGPGTSSGAPQTQEGGLDSSLAQAQEMNLYYLQIQEQVNAQNRSFSALSNVLKAEHDTVKTAIGNIR